MLGNELTIGDRVITFEPLKGKKARKMVPRLITLASGVLYAASQSGLDLRAIFTDEGFDISTLDMNTVLFAVHTALMQLGTDYDSLEDEIFPYLLSVEPEWLAENGTPGEVYKALFEAVKYHLKSSFGPEVAAALKNWQSAVPAVTPEPMSETN